MTARPNTGPFRTTVADLDRATQVGAHDPEQLFWIEHGLVGAQAGRRTGLAPVQVVVLHMTRI